MATLEEKAFASMVTRKREQISNNAHSERFMGDVYCNGFKNGYLEHEKIAMKAFCKVCSFEQEECISNDCEYFVKFKQAMEL